MSQHSDRRPPYTEQDRTDLERIKESVRGRLRQQRAVSEVIWDAAHDMCEADRRGRWPMDMTEETGGGRRKPTRAQWASKVFGISERHARRLFHLGEGCKREEVAGTGLCLDRMDHFCQSPKAIRDLIRALGIEGLSPRALSAGRRAAEPFLEDDDIAGARKEAERVARRVDRGEEREDQSARPRPAPPDPRPDDHPDAGQAFELASKALKQVEALQQVPLHQLHGGPLDLLVDVTERLACGARQVRDRAVGKVDDTRPTTPYREEPRTSTSEGSKPATSPYREELRTSTSENSKPATFSYQYANPEPEPLWYRDVVKGLKGLDICQLGMMAMGVYGAKVGMPLKEVVELLFPAYQGLLKAGVSPEVAEHWMASLTDEDPEKRGYFAAWFSNHVGMVEMAIYVTDLTRKDQPEDLRRRADAMVKEMKDAWDRKQRIERERYRAERRSRTANDPRG